MGVTQAELARLLGYSAESVRIWTQQGCPRRDDGSYIVAEVVTWLRDRAVETALAEVKAKEKPPTELNRKLAAEADLKEMQVAQMRRTIMTFETHDQVLARVVMGFNTVAAGQLQRFERDVRRAQTALEARSLIERIQEALMEGAQSLADELDGEAAAQIEEDAA